MSIKSIFNWIIIFLWNDNSDINVVNMLLVILNENINKPKYNVTPYDINEFLMRSNQFLNKIDLKGKVVLGDIIRSKYNPMDYLPTD